MAAAPRRDVEISGLTADSRAVAPGYLFAALPGARLDGARFVADAAARGACAVLARPSARPAARAAGLAFVASENPRRRYARIAARFFAAQPRVTVAVTGTNGKTSVAWFLRRIWEKLGHSAASLGTLGLAASRPPRLRAPAGAALTTPDPADLHRALAALAEAGVDRLAIEASSHGLAQHRIDGVELAAAAFTGFGRDHLDYHGSEEAYFAAKLRLFSELLPAGGLAALCADTPRLPELLRACRGRGHRVATYGRAGDARLRAVREGAAYIEIHGAPFVLEDPPVGAFQIVNLLGALVLAVGCGADPAAAAAAARGIESPPGRLQRIGAGDPAVYVDYAHTPDALRAALLALRPHAVRRLAVVFGCGGDRDRGKRREMGAVAARLADRAVVTDDNPRGEDPAAIRAAVRAGCPDAEDIADRRAAIAAAVRGLDAGDVLLIAGKGHETGQIVGESVLPFDDAAVTREILGGAP